MGKKKEEDLKKTPIFAPPTKVAGKATAAPSAEPRIRGERGINQVQRSINYLEEEDRHSHIYASARTKQTITFPCSLTPIPKGLLSRHFGKKCVVVASRLIRPTQARGGTTFNDLLTSATKKMLPTPSPSPLPSPSPSLLRRPVPFPALLRFRLPCRVCCP
jgi:hypothetical protein